MLSAEIIDELIASAKQCAPWEMCGLLFPTDGFHALANCAAYPEQEFLIEHHTYLLACVNHGEKPWATVHSHPGKGAGPSLKDCQLMDALQEAGNELAMVIVGLQPVEIRCFKKVGDLYQLQWGQVPAKQPMTRAAFKAIRDGLRRGLTNPHKRGHIDYGMPEV